MTAVSSVNISSQSSVDARSHTAQSRSARSPSLLHLVKAAGVLALALSGGAQAAGVRSFQNDRRLLRLTSQPYRSLTITTRFVSQAFWIPTQRV